MNAGTATLTRSADATGEAATLPFVSVVIPVYNDRAGLERCLEALGRQTYRADRVEILVVDNGSESAIGPLTTRYDRVQLLLEPEGGSYRARNKGIANARGDVVAFTDADCIPDPRWLEEGVRKLESIEACGFVAGKIELFGREPGRPTACERYEQLYYLDQSVAVERGRFGATANLFTYRSVIDRVGPFDEVLKSSGDKEWGNRACGYGYHAVYCEAALVRHPARANVRSLIRKTIRITGGLNDLQSKEDGGILPRLRQELPMWKPPVRKLLDILSGTAARGVPRPVDRVKIAGIALMLHYVRRFEFARLFLGGSPRNW